MKIYKSNDNNGRSVFVFGSNLAGRHGGGAALVALRYWGAIYRQGVGRQGMSYAIPTKDENIQTLALGRVRKYVKQFIHYARQHPELTFLVTEVGCGLAGYRVEDIAPMFRDCPPNCELPDRFEEFHALEKLTTAVCKSALA